MKNSDTQSIVLSSIDEMQKEIESLPWTDPACYALWLSQTFFYVRHATRVLSKAAWRCGFEDEDLHKRMLNGINEEKNHELMCTNDLAHIGFSLDDFAELPSTSAYYQTLYSMIDSHGPYSLLGYFVSLEGLGAIGFKNVFPKLKKCYGTGGIQFLEVHAHLDEGHFDQGLSHILSLSEDKKKIVEEVTRSSSVHYISLLKGVKARHEDISNKRTA
ncbi:MAG: hypothetical protein EOP04_19450 [Proteobacteria bacterium]|nr:MAG: hypothetical protein EOP04_19450 [Pseudomonadota bacterium]